MSTTKKLFLEGNKHFKELEAKIKNKIKFDVDGFDATTQIKAMPTNEPVFFKGYRKTTIELASMITMAMKEIFHDYCGTMVMGRPVLIEKKDNITGKPIYVSGEPKVVIKMYFSDNMTPCPEGKVVAIKRIIGNKKDTKEMNMLDRYQRTQSISSAKCFELTNEAKILLSDFMYGGRAYNIPTSINWEKNTEEVSSSSNDPYIKGERKYFTVFNINPEAILRILFGDETVVSTEINDDVDTNNYASPTYALNVPTLEPLKIGINISDPYFANCYHYPVIIVQRNDKVGDAQMLIENPNMPVHGGIYML